MQNTNNLSPSKSSQRDNNIVSKEPPIKLSKSQSTLSIQSLLKNPFRGRGYSSSSSQRHIILQEGSNSPTGNLPVQSQLHMVDPMKETVIQEGSIASSSEDDKDTKRLESPETGDSGSGVRKSNDLTLEEYREELKRSNTHPLTVPEESTEVEEDDNQQQQQQRQIQEHTEIVEERRWPFWYVWRSNPNQSVTAAATPTPPEFQRQQELSSTDNNDIVTTQEFSPEAPNSDDNYTARDNSKPSIPSPLQQDQVDTTNKNETIQNNRRASWFGWTKTSVTTMEQNSERQIIQETTIEESVSGSGNAVNENEERMALEPTIKTTEATNQDNEGVLQQQLKFDSNGQASALDNVSQKEWAAGTWWNPFTWNGGPVSLKHSETVRSTEESRKAANYVRLQSANNQKTASWAYYATSSSSEDESKGGQVSVIGTFTAKNPINIDHLPRSQFEIQESSFDLGSAANTSLVLPDLCYNYRELTMKTKSRILLSSLGPLSRLFLQERHLYHISTNKNDQHHYHHNHSAGSEKKTEVARKKAVVIGIHGFYPIKFIKTLLGESTHTASEMVEMTAKQLTKWGINNDIEVDIETIALEGYGKIFERASGVLSLLDNWMESISSCNYLFIVSHSVGVPIAVHIASRLTTAGYLDQVSKIGLINISGICMGPFSGLDSRLSIKAYSNFEKDMLLEIFDFQDPESLQSREFLRHLKILISRNVKLTFMGSINDQLVPIYSSLNVQIKHPNIYRAVYIDGDTYQPDFLVSLMNLLLITKNLNYDDHDLLVELSSFLAGIPNRAGHSRVLEDENVYMEGIKNTLETNDLIFQKPAEEQLMNVKDFNINQYHVPWCLRGFLQELPNLKHFDYEEMVEQLLKEYRLWEPVTKQQKELKFCIEILGSMRSEELYI